MLLKGQFIARIPNDEHAESKIAEFKRQHGQLRLCGRHKDRKGTMKSHGLTPDSRGDIPYRLATEIVIYRAENGMTYQQFKSLQVGDLVAGYHIYMRSKFGATGMVVEKKGKNKLTIVWSNGLRQRTTRNKVILFSKEKA